MRTFLAAALIAAMLLVSGVTPAPAAQAPTIRVAVLPFVNTSVRPESAYIGPMIQDLLGQKIAATGMFELSDPENVRRQVRASSYDPDILSTPEVIRRTGETLQADLLLTGKYERTGGYLTLEVRILDTERGNIILGTSGVSLYKDLFNACDEVVISLVRICQLTLDAGAHSRMKANPTENLGAYSSYADALLARDAGDVKAALDFLAKAIDVDPGFCKALRLALELSAATPDQRRAGWVEQSARCTDR